MADTDTTTPEPDVLAGMDEAMGVEAPAVDEAAETPTEGEQTPEAAKPEGEDEAAKAAAEQAAADAAKAEADKGKDEAAEKEIDELGLKDKAQARFREMAAEVKELAPLKEVKAQLEAAGIKDVAELPKLVQRANDGDELIKFVQSTGADAEQYGKTMDYLSVVNRALKGDPQAGEQAWTALMSEVQSLAQALGKEVPGVHDPLSAHADLKAAVDAGELDRPRALEVAKARSLQVTTTQQQQAAQQQQAQQQAAQKAEADIAALDQQLMTADPHYKTHRRAALSKQVAFIRQSLPPTQWAAATKAAYDAIAMLPVAEAPKAPPPPGPVRPGPSTPQLQKDFDDPMEALNAALKIA